ncbi:MAG: acyl-[acyl-carrier-protein]--UDP-N-acetylglucosamine O-acyltransferase [Gammaproteobacteria bacterium RIFCSPHIGHO2_12_FULL_41_20]|nr:MAG: acyl-[acyl-carrier-protein]--UDP-N-acetylglucosamine O-acyltransferase [Gammaproteobacteria bacterium RIFCSPHIGHO2_12_FULL_41_20]
MIDKAAIIHSSAKIAAKVTIGPGTVIGPEVEIGEGTWVGPLVVINGPTKIGRDNKIYQFASIGEVPQDLKFQGERTFLEIGDRNIVREFCTINRGTAQDKSITRIGNDNLFMAYVHIAHDCEIGNHTIFANNASLAGHVRVDDYANLGGFSGVFQRCRVGSHSFATTGSMIIKDVPPYIKVAGSYAKPYGLNIVGLQRHGFTPESILQLRRAYKILYRKGLTLKNALLELHAMMSECPRLEQFIQFVEASTAGITR